jgi:hypothetical protein
MRHALINVSETEHNSVRTGHKYAVENECAPAGELLMSAKNYTYNRTQRQSQQLQQYTKYMKYEAHTPETSWQPCCGSVDCTAACLINTLEDVYIAYVIRTNKMHTFFINVLI